VGGGREDAGGRNAEGGVVGGGVGVVRGGRGLVRDGQAHRGWRAHQGAVRRGIGERVAASESGIRSVGKRSAGIQSHRSVRRARNQRGCERVPGRVGGVIGQHPGGRDIERLVVKDRVGVGIGRRRIGR